MRTFRPSELDEFHTHHRQFRSLFDGNAPGAALWSRLNTTDAYSQMRIVGTAVDLPAVAGIAKECWPYIRAATTPSDRKRIASAIGGMVRTIMVANGHKKRGLKRAVPPVFIDGEWRRVFKTGEVYD